MTTIKQKICNFDKICDYIPIVSTFTNLVDLIAKAIFKIFHVNASDKNSISGHLSKKPVGECIALMIPFLGNIYVFSHRTAKQQVEDRRKAIEALKDLGKSNAKKGEAKTDATVQDFQRELNIEKIPTHIANTKKIYTKMAEGLDSFCAFDDIDLDTLSIKPLQNSPSPLTQLCDQLTSFTGCNSFALGDLHAQATQLMQLIPPSELEKNSSGLDPDTLKLLQQLYNDNEKIEKLTKKIYATVTRDLASYEMYPDEKRRGQSHFMLEQLETACVRILPDLKQLPKPLPEHHPLRRSNIENVKAIACSWQKERDTFLKQDSEASFQALKKALDKFNSIFTGDKYFTGLDYIGMIHEPEVQQCLQEQFLLVSQLKEKMAKEEMKNYLEAFLKRTQRMISTSIEKQNAFEQVRDRKFATTESVNLFLQTAIKGNQSFYAIQIAFEDAKKKKLASTETVNLYLQAAIQEKIYFHQIENIFKDAMKDRIANAETVNLYLQAAIQDNKYFFAIKSIFEDALKNKIANAETVNLVLRKAIQDKESFYAVKSLFEDAMKRKIADATTFDLFIAFAKQENRKAEAEKAEKDKVLYEEQKKKAIQNAAKAETVNLKMKEATKNNQSFSVIERTFEDAMKNECANAETVNLYLQAAIQEKKYFFEIENIFKDAMKNEIANAETVNLVLQKAIKDKKFFYEIENIFKDAMKDRIANAETVNLVLQKAINDDKYFYEIENIFKDAKENRIANETTFDLFIACSKNKNRKFEAEKAEEDKKAYLNSTKK